MIMPSIDEDGKKQKYSNTAGENVKLCSHSEKSLTVSYKLKHTLTT